MTPQDRNTEMQGCCLLLQGHPRCNAVEDCGQFATQRTSASFQGPNFACDAHSLEQYRRLKETADEWKVSSPGFYTTLDIPRDMPLAVVVRRFNALLRNEV
jgi:hypothetical protein